MFKNKVNIIESTLPPTNKNDWWYDYSSETLKQWKNGTWINTLRPQASSNGVLLYETTDDNKVTSIYDVFNNGSISVLQGNKIEKEAYKNKTTLSNVVLLEGITSIETGAFRGCSNLSKIILPNSLRVIKKEAFSGCNVLGELHIPDNIDMIEPGSLPVDKSSSLFNISGKGVVDGIFLTSNNSLLYTVPNAVDYYKQEDDSYLISLPPVATLADRCFAYIQPYYDDEDNIYGITLNIPYSVVNIHPIAFANTAPSIFKFTGKGASSDGLYLYKDNTLFLYAGCNPNTEANVAEGIVRVEQRAFNSCTNIITVKLPTSIKSIGQYTFYGCSALTTIYCAATTPPVLDNGKDLIPSNVTKIYVPTDSVSAYKSATNWTTYASKITGYNF